MSQELSDFLQEEIKKQGWSVSEFARRAKVSVDTAARAARGEGTVTSGTLRKFAKALGRDEATLLRFGGHLESKPKGLQDAAVIALARRLEDLPPRHRRAALLAVEAVVDAIQSLDEE